jgi:hypothetical protein
LVLEAEELLAVEEQEHLVLVGLIQTLYALLDWVVVVGLLVQTQQLVKQLFTEDYLLLVDLLEQVVLEMQAILHMAQAAAAAVAAVVVHILLEI